MCVLFSFNRLNIVLPFALIPLLFLTNATVSEYTQGFHLIKKTESQKEREEKEMKGNRLPTTGSVNINQLNLEFGCQFSIQQKTNLHPEKTLNIPFCLS